MPDKDKRHEGEMINSDEIVHHDQAEGGEELGAVEEMVGKTPGQAEGELETIEEKLEKDDSEEKKAD